MYEKSVYAFALLVVCSVSIGWYVDRINLLRTIESHVTHKANEKATEPEEEGYVERKAGYKEFKEYELYHRYLNEPNQIWVSYDITQRILRKTRDVEKSLSDELIEILWRLWKHEDQYNMSEWGIEQLSSEELSRQILYSLSCTNTKIFRELIRKHPRFQSHKDFKDFRGEMSWSWSGPTPTEMYPEFHKPNSSEFQSLDEFLGRAFEDTKSK